MNDKNMTLTLLLKFHTEVLQSTNSRYQSIYAIQTPGKKGHHKMPAFVLNTFKGKEYTTHSCDPQASRVVTLWVRKVVTLRVRWSTHNVTWSTCNVTNFIVVTLCVVVTLLVVTGPTAWVKLLFVCLTTSPGFILLLLMIMIITIAIRVL